MAPINDPKNWPQVIENQWQYDWYVQFLKKLDSLLASEREVLKEGGRNLRERYTVLRPYILFTESVRAKIEFYQDTVLYPELRDKS